MRNGKRWERNDNLGMDIYLDYLKPEPETGV